MTTNLHDKMLKAIDAYFSASDAVEEEVAENLLLDVRDAINKHKLATESLNEGLRLDDWDKIVCVNHDCDKCKAQQEPVAMYRNKCADGSRCLHGCHANEPCYTTPQPPAQRKPLTDEQILDAYCKTPGIFQFVSAFKAGARYAESAHGITKGNT